jgi:hypothetical protein
VATAFSFATNKCYGYTPTVQVLSQLLVKRMIKSGIKFPSGRLELDMLMHFSQVFCTSS